MATRIAEPPTDQANPPGRMPADQDEIQTVAARLASAAPQDVLSWTVDRFAPLVAVSCSFGGPSGTVLIEMLARLGLLDQVKVYFIDTGLLFAESHTLRSKLERRYGFEAVRYEPAIDLQAQALQYGDELWSRDPDACCGIRRVAPNVEALRGQHAWVAGIRRDQSTSRANTPAVAWNARHEVVKVAPLATWTDAMVWDYVRRYDVPVNDLHADGYPSLGCTVCTTRVDDGEHLRSGRWRNSDKTECGLHWQI